MCVMLYQMLTALPTRLGSSDAHPVTQSARRTSGSMLVLAARSAGSVNRAPGCRRDRRSLILEADRRREVW
jgi:hypothetical protein